ncbi:hypothetical protein LWI29_026627 [Acer saccharum]|uniref:RNA helicase aquarius N-terminal domain-containing protein n=1 Tax=Acer saccharum TaxID=4024 RepID=A0AA39UW80_ACESA|nr:hypothetical protein LWI29_026627 [Acer saccharum]
MPVHTLPIHDDGTFNFLPPTSSVPHESAPHEDTISSATSLDNEMSLDAPPVSDSSPVSTSAQPIPPIRSVRSRQPPSYLKNYHCPTLPHVANLVQSDSKEPQVDSRCLEPARNKKARVFLPVVQATGFATRTIWVVSTRKRQRRNAAARAAEEGAEAAEEGAEAAEEDPGAVPAGDHRPDWVEEILKAQTALETRQAALEQRQTSMEQGMADLTKAIRDSLWSATERHGGAGPSSEIQRDRLTKTASENWFKVEKPFDAELVKEIYKTELTVKEGRKTVPLHRVMILEVSQYLENYLWPNFDSETASFEHVMSMILMVNEKFRENVAAWICFYDRKEAFRGFLERVIRLKEVCEHPSFVIFGSKISGVNRK